MSNKPLQLKLRILWVKDSLGLAVDQIGLEEHYALTPYYFWPKTEAWEQLKLNLNSKFWLTQDDKMAILKTTSEVMEYWLFYRNSTTVKKFKEEFKDVKVITLDSSPKA